MARICGADGSASIGSQPQARVGAAVIALRAPVANNFSVTDWWNLIYRHLILDIRYCRDDPNLGLS